MRWIRKALLWSLVALLAGLTCYEMRRAVAVPSGSRRTLKHTVATTGPTGTRPYAGGSR
jgi:hypothetical protein